MDSIRSCFRCSEKSMRSWPTAHLQGLRKQPLGLASSVSPQQDWALSDDSAGCGVVFGAGEGSSQTLRFGTQR